MPTPSIPAGYSLTTFTFNVTGSARNVMTTIATRNPGDFSAGPTNVAMRSVFVAAAARPFNATTLPTTYQLVSVKTLSNIGGLLYSAEDFTVVTGTGSTTPLPMNTALLVNKVTGLAGRKYRGRCFAPMVVSEGNVDQAGIITAGTLTTLQSSWDAAFTAIDTAGYQPVLLHSDGTTPTDVTSFAVSQRIGTIGRRMRG